MRPERSRYRYFANMMRPFLLRLASGLVNVAASLVVAGALLARQNWFGAGDTEALLAWTLPLAAVVAVVGPAVLSVGRRWPAVGRGGLLLAATVLLVLGWLLLVGALLGPWMGAFSFSVLYPWLAGVGAQLYVLQRGLPVAPTARFGWRYWLVGTAGLLGALVGMMGLVGLRDYLNRPTPETYLIPSAFRGEFRVVYGEPGGVNPAMVNGRRVLKLPASGILIVQPAYEAGILDNDYYLVDAVGHRQKIDYNYNDSLPTQPRVELLGAGSLGMALPADSSAAQVGASISCTWFAVLDPPPAAFSEAQQQRQQQQLDSLTIALVLQRRAALPATKRKN